MFYVYFTNHGYYAEPKFETLESALEYAKRIHFSASIVSTTGSHPYHAGNNSQLVASWDPIGGTHIRGRR